MEPRRALANRLRTGLGNAARTVLPLALRKRLAVAAGRAGTAGVDWLPAELIRDLAQRDPDAYHRFLWSNHLGYASTYEPDLRFGESRLHPSRRLLFREMRLVLSAAGIPAARVRSVLEVGASMGYLLRHLELEAFSAAETLHGIDIDAYAVSRGQQILSAAGSRVRLAVGDAARLHDVFGEQRYDVVLCAGVLMYLTEPEAQASVAAQLARCQGLLVIAGLAHPEVDNRLLGASQPRAYDRSLIHNLDRMVERAGGRIVHRQWDGARQVKGNSIYFLFATPGARP